MEQNITEQLVEFLRSKKVDFIKLSEMKADIKKLKTQLNLGKDLKKAIIPHLGDVLMLKLGNRRSTYLVLKQTGEDLLLRIIKNQSGKAPGTIANDIPFTKSEFLTLLNRMIEQGRILVKIKAAEYKPTLYPAENVCPRTAESKGTAVSEEAFRAAFQELEQGKIFVDIYALRRRLNWPKEKFDAMLQKLRNAGTIHLYVGDATTMTPDEIADGFVDKNGFRMASLTWNQ
jgi:hypothetical protein